MTCELCGQPRIVFLTLLRAPWSDEIVNVKACNGCSPRAWRTVSAPRRETIRVEPPPKLELKLAEGRA